MKIDLKQFLVNQPSFPADTPTDGFYLRVANKLLEAALGSAAKDRWHPEVLRAASLVLTGYLQDVVADAGVWRGFINECRRLYGKSLPFFEIGEGYIDYELNAADVRFMTWYSLAMLYEPTRQLYPEDPICLELADAWYSILEKEYDDAPVPEDFHLAHGMEIHDPEEAERVARLAHWLYLHCWLLMPANSMTLTEIVSGLPESEGGRKELTQRLDQAMNEMPTGPLALFLREWLWLVAEDRMPPLTRAEKAAAKGEKPEHPYYSKFMEATGGKKTAYFKTYGELNEFFIRALGWKEGEEHLSAMKENGYFVLFVNREKGMLLARDAARAIADPGNPYYDKKYAREHAFDFLTVRGRCPNDLTKYCCAKGWLPDAVFPGFPESHAMVEANWDFICRCYLQLYYRD